MKAEKKVKSAKNKKGSGVTVMQWFLAILITVVGLAGAGGLIAVAYTSMQTVSVAMWSTNGIRNGVITADSVQEYKMLRGEYERYAVDSKTGVTHRLVLWEDAPKLYGKFMSRQIYSGSLVVTEDVMVNRIDNSNMVLYSYPGRQIIALEVVQDDLNYFKTFLEPGDKISVMAYVTEERPVTPYYDTAGAVSAQGGGNNAKTDNAALTVTNAEPLFNSVYIADMLNSSGESVLDAYAYYNSLSAAGQAALDSSDAWEKETTPVTLLVALTDAELRRYAMFEGLSDVTYRMSVPQRGE